MEQTPYIKFYIKEDVIRLIAPVGFIELFQIVRQREMLRVVRMLEV